MAKTPKNPPGVQTKNGRHYRVQYIGMVDGVRKYKWTALTKDLASSTLMAAKITSGDIRIIGAPTELCKDELEKFVLKALKSCERRSVEKGIENDIDIEFLLSLARKNEWRCSVTGVKFDLRQLNKHHGRPFAPSIDRIKSDLGYTKDNVRLVCLAANYAMNQWGEAVLDMLLAAYLNRKLAREHRIPDEGGRLSMDELLSMIDMKRKKAAA